MFKELIEEIKIISRRVLNAVMASRYKSYDATYPPNDLHELIDPLKHKFSHPRGKLKAVIVAWDEDADEALMSHFSRKSAALATKLRNRFKFHLVRETLETNNNSTGVQLTQRVRQYTADLGGNDILVFYYIGRCRISGPRSTLQGTSDQGQQEIPGKEIVDGCFQGARFGLIAWTDFYCKLDERDPGVGRGGRAFERRRYQGVRKAITDEESPPSYEAATAPDE